MQVKFKPCEQYLVDATSIEVYCIRLCLFCGMDGLYGEADGMRRLSNLTVIRLGDCWRVFIGATRKQSRQWSSKAI